MNMPLSRREHEQKNIFFAINNNGGGLNTGGQSGWALIHNRMSDLFSNPYYTDSPWSNHGEAQPTASTHIPSSAVHMDSLMGDEALGNVADSEISPTDRQEIIARDDSLYFAGWSVDNQVSKMNETRTVRCLPPLKCLPKSCSQTDAVMEYRSSEPPLQTGPPKTPRKQLDDLDDLTSNVSLGILDGMQPVMTPGKGFLQQMRLQRGR